MDYERPATQLEATSNDEVLRRFAPAELYAPLDGVDPQHLRVAMVVDTETTGPEECTIRSHLLERSVRTTCCGWAEGAPFEMKVRLKRDKGYAWSDGTRPGQPIKAWYRTGVIDLAAELAMLGRQIDPRPARVTVDGITGRERYTDRYRSREKMPVDAGS